MRHTARRNARLRVLALALPLALTFSAVRCGGSGGDQTPTGPSTPTSNPVSSVSLTGAPPSQIAFIGTTVQLTATPLSAAGVALTGRTVTWSSSNDAVISVSPAGLITALAPGEAMITATSETRSASTTLQSRFSVTLPAAGASGPATTSILNGAAVLSIPPGAVAAGITLDAAPATSPAANPLLVSSTAFTFGPAGTQFAQPVTLTLKFDPAAVAVGERASLAVYLESNGAWQRVTGSTVSLGDNAVSAPITHFSTYALLRRGPPATVTVTAGAAQSAIVNTAISTPPSVTVRDAQGVAFEGVTVTFAVASGGGTITGATQVTNASGVATIGSWTLGAIVGAQSLTATVSGVPAATISATALPVPPPGVIGVPSTSLAIPHFTACPAPLTGTVAITNSGAAGSALTGLQVTTTQNDLGAPWLSASLSGTTAPATLTVSAIATDLPPGAWGGRVVISSTAAGVSPVTINVAVPVGGTGVPVLTTSTPTVTFEALPRSSGIQRATVAIDRVGVCPVLSAITMRKVSDPSPVAGWPSYWGAGWSRGGILPDVLNIEMIPFALTPGQYTGYIEVGGTTVNGPSPAPVRVNIVTNIAATTPVVAISREFFDAVRGANDPATGSIATLEVQNAGPGGDIGFLGAITLGPITHTAPNVNWLRITPTLTPGFYSLTFDATGLPRCTSWTATFPVRAVNAPNEHTVTVTLAVHCTNPVNFEITRQPGWGVVNQPLSVQPQLRFLDFEGVVTPHAGNIVNVQLIPLDGAVGTLAGTQTAFPIDGVNTFQNLRVTAAGRYQLQFFGGVPTKISDPFTVFTTTPTTLEKAGGDAQSGATGTALPQPLRVRVRDSNGAVMANVPVSWQVMSGGATVSATSTTDAQGEATVTVTPTAAGAFTIRATIQGLTTPSVSFSGNGL